MKTQKTSINLLIGFLAAISLCFTLACNGGGKKKSRPKPAGGNTTSNHETGPAECRNADGSPARDAEGNVVFSCDDAVPPSDELTSQYDPELDLELGEGELRPWSGGDKLPPPDAGYEAPRDCRTPLSREHAYYDPAGDTGYSLKVDGEPKGYVDLFSGDGVMIDLRNRVRNIQDSIVQKNSVELARSVKDVVVDMEGRRVVVQVNFEQKNGVIVPITLDGDIVSGANGSDEAILEGYGNSGFVFTGRLQCLDSDGAYCQNAAISLYQYRDTDGDGSIEVCKRVYISHRMGDVGLTLPENVRSYYKQSQNPAYVDFIGFIEKTINFNEESRNCSIYSYSNSDSHARSIRIRTWAVAEGPSRFIVTLSAQASTSNRGSFYGGGETSFQGPLLANFADGRSKSIPIESGNYGLLGPGFGISNGPGAFGHNFSKVWLNESGTNGVLNVGMLFEQPRERVDINFAALLKPVGNRRHRPKTPAQPRPPAPPAPDVEEPDVRNDFIIRSLKDCPIGYNKFDARFKRFKFKPAILKQECHITYINR